VGGGRRHRVRLHPLADLQILCSSSSFPEISCQYPNVWWHKQKEQMQYSVTNETKKKKKGSEKKIMEYGTELKGK
jgi:hypothetical protein